MDTFVPESKDGFDSEHHAWLHRESVTRVVVRKNLFERSILNLVGEMRGMLLLYHHQRGLVDVSASSMSAKIMNYSIFGIPGDTLVEGSLC